ncbi:hypothetical protein CHS0354_015511 [Potamilus streckersoni]|uniref:Uncharacterized protein n=1 Tax=Potamilus streckersoni TaxID=2493646 RepID=A0AAE0VVG9_9BIVA|nr:hypothetical protein CHS0354_015511 [Potamilus streckersoni]
MQTLNACFIKTLSRIWKRFNRPGLGVNAKDWCGRFDQCSARMRPYKVNRAPMTMYTVATPMERIVLDILEHFPVSNHGKYFFVVIRGCFIKWMEAYTLILYCMLHSMHTLCY